MASTVDIPGIAARVLASIAMVWQSVWLAEWWRYFASHDGSIGSFAYLVEGFALSLGVTIYIWSGPWSQRVADVSWGAAGALAGFAFASGFSIGATLVPSALAFFFAMAVADTRAGLRTERGIAFALLAAVVQVAVMLGLARLT
ncbi:MAG TPA: hypothetical protein VF701_00815 [Thermoanaerobaculia bacterium]